MRKLKFLLLFVAILFGTSMWAATPFIVSYDANGGYFAPASQEKVLDKDLTLQEGDDLFRPGYKADGWSTSPTGEKVYDFGATYSDNADIVLYAHWEIDASTLVSYWDGKNELLGQEIATFNRPEAPEVEGFTFMYWQVKEGPLSDGIELRAIYQANTPSSAPRRTVGKYTMVRKEDTDNEYILELTK